MRLELWYPVSNNPWTINQAWGILNLAYKQFGFTRHNGTDIPLPPDGKLLCPVKAVVHETGYFPNGAGNYIYLITVDKWEVNGAVCNVFLTFMHNKEIIKKKGDVCEVGDLLAIPDNTGFSTGPHIHMGGYRLNDDGTFMDKNEANDSFDLIPFFNGFYAKDVNTVIGTYKKIIDLLTNFLKGRPSK